MNENIVNNKTLNKPNASEARRTRGLYAIFDRRKMAYLSIMEKQNNALALRDFEIITNSKEGIISKYPEDFALYKVGKFDEENGELINENMLVIEANEVLKES